MKAILAILGLTLFAEGYAEGACTKEKIQELSRSELALPRLYGDVRQAKMLHGLKDHRGYVRDNSEQVAQTEAALDETKTKVDRLRQECRTPERDRQEALYRSIERETALARAAEREAARSQQEVLDRLAAMEHRQQEQARTHALLGGIEETQRNWKLDELADSQRRAQWKTEDRLRDLESQVETQQRKTYWMNQELGHLRSQEYNGR